MSDEVKESQILEEMMADFELNLDNTIGDLLAALKEDEAVEEN
jgi:hypothetical protein